MCKPNTFLIAQNTSYKFWPCLFYSYSDFPVMCSSSSLFFPDVFFEYHYTDNQEILIYNKFNLISHFHQIYKREVYEKEMKF